jgi:glucokinase
VLADGSRLTRSETETPTTAGPDAIVAACIDQLARARSAAPHGMELSGIGISSAGPVDPASGVVLEPPNFGPGFRDVPLARVVREAFDLPTFLDRDTNVAALGERAFGAARGIDDVIYLTVSTGVGGGVVQGGRLLRGWRGLAGELGHVPVSLEGPRCGCGGIGHLEAYASGTGLARGAREALASGTSPYLAAASERLGGASRLSAREVAQGALAGDPACTRLMTDARRALAAACVGFVNAFDPRRIVIGGSIAEAEGDRLLDPVRRAIAQEVFAVMAAGVDVVPAALGGDVSLAGCHPLVVSRLAEASHPASVTTPG